MRVLIAEHIEFQRDEDDNQSAFVFGDYRVVTMTESEFFAWSEDTGEDWISEEYDGEIYFSSRADVKKLFKEIV